MQIANAKAHAALAMVEELRQEIERLKGGR